MGELNKCEYIRPRKFCYTITLCLNFTITFIFPTDLIKMLDIKPLIINNLRTHHCAFSSHKRQLVIGVYVYCMHACISNMWWLVGGCYFTKFN